MTSHRLSGRSEAGFTMIELTVVTVILGVLLALAISAVGRARLAGNETSAIGSLRTINNAQFTYAVECGSGNYATSLVVLATKPPGHEHPFLNVDLGSEAAPTRSGYTMTIRPGNGGTPAVNDCLGMATQSRYYATATPETPGTTGNRAFATNQAGTIWQDNGGAPPAEPFAAPATPIQ